MKRYIKSSQYSPFDFENYIEAKRFLNSVEQDKIDLVEQCRKDLLSIYSDPDAFDYDKPLGTKESEILRDYKSAAAEDWEDCTVDEADELFDYIMQALDELHKDDAMGWL